MRSTPYVENFDKSVWQHWFGLMRVENKSESRTVKGCRQDPMGREFCRAKLCFNEGGNFVFGGEENQLVYERPVDHVAQKRGIDALTLPTGFEK